MVCKQLMDMCIQVAKGMEYVACMKMVHIGIWRLGTACEYT